MLEFMTTRKQVEVENASIYQSWRIDEVDAPWVDDHREFL